MAVADGTAPLVSVVIPCYNQGRFVAEAVASALGQTYGSIEVVITDDASTDGFTAAEVRRLAVIDPRIRTVFHQVNEGLAVARNSAVRASNGEFILPLDADDKIHPQFLEKTVPLLRDRGDVGVVYTDSETFGCERARHYAGEFVLAKALAMQTFGCTVLFRRRDFDQVGGYNSECFALEQWDLLLSLLELGLTAAYVPEPLFLYRQHANGSMTDESQRRRPETLRRLVRRHRRLFDEHWQDVLYYKDQQIASLLQMNRQVGRWQQKVVKTPVYKGYAFAKRLFRRVAGLSERPAK
jgi:glycosyltransferase involved in cell wall biosynthesis